MAAKTMIHIVSLLKEGNNLKGIDFLNTTYP